MAHIVRNALNRNLAGRQTLDYEYMQGQYMYEEQIRRQQQLDGELGEDEQYDEEGKLIMSPEQQKALEEARRKQAEEHRKALMEKKKEVIGKIKKKAKINDTAAGIFSMLGLAIAFIEVENNYDDTDKERNVSSDWGQGARGIVFCLTAILLICIVRYHYLEYRIQRER